MSVSIVIASPFEADKVADVFLSSRQSMTYLPNVHTDDETRHYITSLVSSGKIHVLKEDNVIAGLMMVEDGYLHHLYVDPKFHNKGYGKMLLDKAKELSFDGLQLWVFEQNKGAIKFYEREGFVLVNKRDEKEQDNEEGLADRKYTWHSKM